MPAGQTAFITGIGGQDGAYLARLLLERGYGVIGGARNIADDTLWRLRSLGVLDRIELVVLDLRDPAGFADVLRARRPDAIYNLAAQSLVSESFANPGETEATNAAAVARMLDDLRGIAPEARFYQASSSEMFGGESPPQDEATPFHPLSPYAASKAKAHLLCRQYREAHGLFVSAGILFNHESPLRAPAYVTRKICAGLVAAKLAGDRAAPVRLGNLDARRDWGYAEDYARGIADIMEHAVADEFVLATGIAHSVRDFASAAAEALGFAIEWSGAGADEVGRDRASGRILVTVDPHFFRPADLRESVGNAAKAARALGWRPRVDFEGLVSRMIEAEYDRALKRSVAV